MDDGIPLDKDKDKDKGDGRRRRRRSEGNSERKVINVEAALVEEVNEYAEELEDKFGFRPTFTQAMMYILKELKQRKS